MNWLRSIKRLLRLALCGALLSVVPPVAAESAGPRSVELVRLQYILKRLENSQLGAAERQALLELARKECHSAGAQPYKLTQLRNEVLAAFQNTYDGGGNQGLSLKDVTTIESLLPGIFGPNNERLVALLNGPRPPSTWGNEELRRFLREHLQHAGAADLKTEAGLQNPHDRVIRWGFLAAVAASERGRFESALESWCKNAGAADMPPVAGPEKNAALPELESALGSDFTHRSRLEGLLAEQLYGLPVQDWAKAEGSFLPLGRLYRNGLPAFFKKATNLLYANRNDRAALQVLVTLTANVDAATAGSEWLGTEPRRSDVEWFKWLHQPGLLPYVHRNHAASLDDSFEILQRFATPADRYPRMHDLAANYYYGYRQQQVFDRLLRPYARGPHTQLILSEALAGKFGWKHREILGVDLLDPDVVEKTGALAPVWAGSAIRLKIAADIFNGLVENSDHKPAYSDLADSVLLDRIVDEMIKLIRLQPPQVDKVVELFDPVATMLAGERSPNDAGSVGQPLQKLESELAKTLLNTLAMLTQAPADGALSDAAGKQIDSFVGLTRLCLRLNALIRKASGHSPGWLAEVRRGVGVKVFGLEANHENPPVLEWPENVRLFRARVLARLDGPLAECLEGEPEESQRWWREIYLPLVRVKGLLTTLQNLSPGGTRAWPHLAWVAPSHGAAAKRRTAGPARGSTINDERLDDLFGMLDTMQWLDAAGPVEDLTKVDLGRLGASPQAIWDVDPAKLFAQKWSINAGWLTWKKFLDAAPPLPQHEWRLEAITRQILSGLKNLPQQPIPGAPAVSSYASWTLNVLAATEWQRSPFLGADGNPLSWEDRVTPSGDAARPFVMKIKGTEEASRQIRSDLRMRLVDEILLSAASESNAPDDQIDHLVEAVLYLANSHDNQSSSDTVDLDACRAARQKAYMLAYQRYQLARDFEDRFQWLHQLMLLQASNRKVTPLEPDFSGLLEHLIQETDITSVSGEKLIGLKQDLIKLQNLADDTRDISPAVSRRRLTQELHALVPDALLKNPALLRRNWRERLAAVDEHEVERHLGLLAEFESLLKPEVPPTEADARLAADDMELVSLALTYVDFHLNFSRPDFEGAALLGPTKPARVKVSDGQWRENGSWWPAISILSWCNQTLKAALESRADTVLTSNPGEAEVARAKAAETLLVMSNEAEFLTLSSAVGSPRSVEMLNFNHDLEIRLHNFRLLAESIRTVRTSAKTLTADAFQGVLQNLRLIVHVAPDRSDRVIQLRFFKDLSAGAPAYLRRPEFVQPDTGAPPPERLCLDRLASTSALWMADPKMPPLVRTGAEQFLTVVREGKFPLFSGGATPAGVTAALSGIFAKVRAGGTALPGGNAEAVRRYASFYEAILMGLPDKDGRVSLSDHLYRGLAETMFRSWDKPPDDQGADRLRQQKDFAQLIGWWRSDLVNNPEPSSSVLHGLQAGFGDPLTKLLHGVGKTPGSVYLWQPVDELQGQMNDLGHQLDDPGAAPDAVNTKISAAHLDQAPDRFLDLAKWYFSLGQPTDPPPLLALFDAADQPVAAPKPVALEKGQR